MKRAIAIALLAGLAGCDTGPTREQVLASLVGRSEADAIRALGAPNREFDANGRKFIAYEDARVGYAPAPYFGGFGFGYGYGFYGPAAYPVMTGCVTTLEITGGRVASYTLRGGSC